MKLEKLIRDKLPEIAAEKGEKLDVRIADPSEMPKLVAAKLVEEALEFQEAIESGNPNALVEELADVLEVCGLLDEMFILASDRRREKNQQRGDFSKMLVLRLDPPVPMVLICPNCGKNHVDRGRWAKERVHRSHLCEHCGHVWKPFEFATVGVEAVDADPAG